MATANQPPQTTITITGSPTNSKSKTSTKEKRKRRKNSKSSTNTTSPLQPRTPPPTTATNIAGPKLNQPPPQPQPHHWPKIPTQMINQWPKTHTSKLIPNLTPTTRLRDLKASGEGCGGRRQGLWRLTARCGGERSWADWEGRDREWRREKKE